jgi:hypothetical protein
MTASSPTPKGPLLWFLAVVPACLSGCRDTTPTGETPVAVSDAYSEFDPEAEFMRRGYLIEPTSVGGRISPEEKYGWRPRLGSLILPPKTDGCEAIALAVRDELNRAIGRPCDDDLELDRPRPRGTPYYGMLRYVHQGRRGYVHIWLFPDESETRIQYAILLRESRLQPKSFAAIGH